MTRVRRRMYRRKRRARQVCLLLVLLLVGAVAVMCRRPQMEHEQIVSPTPTPVASSWDRTVTTREITLRAETWYTIQTGVFSARDAALEKADDYTSRGAPGTVVEDGGKWRVFIASYGQEADAAAVRQRLGEMQRVETYLYRWTCPELRLRLSGMAGQLDVAEAGMSLILQTATALRDTAMELDAAQLTADDAARIIADLDAQIGLWVETARERFGRQAPEMVQLMLTIADGWPARKRALAEAASVTELSALCKAHGMELFCEMIGLRRALGAQ